MQRTITVFNIQNVIVQCEDVTESKLSMNNLIVHICIISFQLSDGIDYNLDKVD